MRFFLVAFATIVVEVCLNVSRIFEPSLDTISDHIFASIIKSFACLVFLFLFAYIKINRKESTKLSALTSASFFFLFLFGQLYFSIDEIISFGTINGFIVGLMIYSMTFIVKPMISWVTLVIYCVSMIIILVTYSDNIALSNNLTYAAIVTVIAILSSAMFYNGHLSNYITKTKLEMLSHTDTLTKINNRRGFEAEIDRLWASSVRTQSDFSILMIDIDHFKNYNDNYGHVNGDKCLESIGTCFHNVFVRKTDLYARYGGEEFVVALPNTSEENAYSLATKFRQRVEGLFIQHEYSETAKFITVSIGVATTIPQKGDSFKDLLDKADKALYAAKMNGRNQVKKAVDS